jgi:TonB family protein
MLPVRAVRTLDRPIPTSARIPDYPAMARAKRISGVVLVDVKVNDEGKVIEAEPIMGDEYLRKASKEAALLWRFKPFESKQTPYLVRLTFIFHDVSYKAPEKKPDYRSPYQIFLPSRDLTIPISWWLIAIGMGLAMFVLGKPRLTPGLLVLSGVFFGASHVAPKGPLGMLCFLGAAVCVKFAKEKPADSELVSNGTI